jgi:predicted dehydrogenase
MKVLFLGLGGIGQRHLRILKMLFPQVDVSAVRKRRRLHEVTDQLQLNQDVNIEEKYDVTCFKTVQDAVENQPNFAIISNPTSLHVETAIELVKRKIPVLIEKPISNNDKGVDTLVDLSRKNKTIVAVAYMMRFHPCAVQLGKYIERRAIGKIYSISINVNSYFPAWHKYEKYNEFYAGRSDLGGGVVLTEIHEIDLLNLFFGVPDNLYAIGGKRSKLEIDVEDNVSVLMKYKQDNEEFSVTLNMSFVQQTPLRQFQIFGEYGNILWDITENAITLNNFTHDLSEEFNYDNFQRNDMFESQLLNFVDLIEKNTESDQSLSDSIGGHKIAMAIKKSISNGKIVSFE